MDKYALITGATSGFGKACAEIFARNKWKLILTGRRNDKLLQIKSELEHNGIEVHTLCFDIRNVEEVNAAIKSLPDEISKNIDILINNAGLAAGRDAIQHGNLMDWEQMIDTNVKGLLYVSRAIIPSMILNRRGHIFNISSIAGKEVYPDGNVYCASKHAVDALSQSMRIDLVTYGIKVTNVAPGAAKTEFSLVRFKGNEDQAKSVYNGYSPLLANDIAEIIYFAATRPNHVCINDLVVMPTAQATSTIFHKQ